MKIENTDLWKILSNLNIAVEYFEHHRQNCIHFLCIVGGNTELVVAKK